MPNANAACFTFSASGGNKIRMAALPQNHHTNSDGVDPQLSQQIVVVWLPSQHNKSVGLAPTPPRQHSGGLINSGHVDHGEV
jgi:hypothetical protein